MVLALRKDGDHNHLRKQMEASKTLNVKDPSAVGNVHGNGVLDCHQRMAIIMKKKEYGYGEKHFQKLFIEKKQIVDAECNCIWGQVHKDAWKAGDKICWHLEAAINEFNMEVKNGKFKE